MQAPACQGASVRKLFYGLGVFTAVAVVAAAIGLSIFARNAAGLDVASKEYVDTAAVTIASNWDADEFWKHASGHLRTIAKVEEVRGLFGSARQALGPLLEYRGSQGQALISAVNSHSTITAKYVAKAHFQKGDADLQFVLVKRGDAWLIDGFHIYSSPLIRNSGEARS